MHEIEMPLLELLNKAPLSELPNSQCDYNYAKLPYYNAMVSMPSPTPKPLIAMEM
jgi:hypothetical protein